MLENETWELRKNNILLARLSVTSTTGNTYFAQATTAASFEPYKAVFKEGLFINDQDPDDSEWISWCDKIRSMKLRLIRLEDNKVTDNFILTIDDNEAMFIVQFDTDH